MNENQLIERIKELEAEVNVLSRENMILQTKNTSLLIRISRAKIELNEVI